MSFFPGKDPQAGDTYACEAIAHVVVPRTVDLGDGFSVRRALPSARSRMVGPFIFFDHFGPAEFRAGRLEFFQLSNGETSVLDALCAALA